MTECSLSPGFFRGLIVYRRSPQELLLSINYHSIVNFTLYTEICYIIVLTVYSQTNNKSGYCNLLLLFKVKSASMQNAKTFINLSSIRKWTMDMLTNQRSNSVYQKLFTDPSEALDKKNIKKQLSNLTQPEVVKVLTTCIEELESLNIQVVELKTQNKDYSSRLGALCKENKLLSDSISGMGALLIVLATTLNEVLKGNKANPIPGMSINDIKSAMEKYFKN